MPLYSHVWNAHFPPNNTSNPGCVEGCLWIPTSPHSVDNRSVQESSTSQNCSLLFGEWKRNISTTLSSAKLHWLLIELWYESKFASVSPQWKMFNSANQSIQTAGQMKAEPAWMFGMHCSRTGISIAAHILADANQSCRIRSLLCWEKWYTVQQKKVLLDTCMHLSACTWMPPGVFLGRHHRPSPGTEKSTDLSRSAAWRTHSTSGNDALHMQVLNHEWANWDFRSTERSCW